MLDDRVIKRYLMLRFLRPGTNGAKRSNIHIRKVQSKDYKKVRLGDYYQTNIAKSNSPVKRRELYETPAKNDKPKILLKFIQEKKEVHPKLFEPLDIIKLGSEKRRHQSTGKIIYET
jgi:hypothetical protein